MYEFVFGVMSMGFAVAALFFLRFWRRTHDRLFAFFALAFAVLAINRAGLMVAAHHELKGDYLYWVRFVAFAVILVGIVDKNRSGRGPGLENS